VPADGPVRSRTTPSAGLALGRGAASRAALLPFLRPALRFRGRCVLSRSFLLQAVEFNSPSAQALADREQSAPAYNRVSVLP